jgi:pimeloyl-ACP methyl ester carboxylesterase
MKKQFTIDIEQSVLTDLRERLNEVRWPDEFEGANWQFGTDRTYLQKLCQYWRQTYDWKKQQQYLNSFAHFRSTVDGLGLHFIYQKGEGEVTIPLLLIHGWPDSFVRFLKLIPLLTKADENDVSFDVIVPSIPGHGFSDIPKGPGMNSKHIAKLFTKLMTEELGYEKFIVQGGDVGSDIAEQIALYYPESLWGMHLTNIPYLHIISAQADTLDKAGKQYQSSVQAWQMSQGAYNMIQSTKPQTLAYSINDSPVGLAAWIVEKFYSWSDSHGDLDTSFTKDELLNNIMIYWVTQTANSSFRLYHEAMHDMTQVMYNPLSKINPLDKTGSKVEVPTALALFKVDIAPPKNFVDKFFAVRRWTNMPKGGHFAAMEQPELLANDIRAFAYDLHANPST